MRETLKQARALHVLACACVCLCERMSAYGIIANSYGIKRYGSKKRRAATCAVNVSICAEQSPLGARCRLRWPVAHVNAAVRMRRAGSQKWRVRALSRVQKPRKLSAERPKDFQLLKAGHTASPNQVQVPGRPAAAGRGRNATVRHDRPVLFVLCPPRRHPRMSRVRSDP